MVRACKCNTFHLSVSSLSQGLSRLWVDGIALVLPSGKSGMSLWIKCVRKDYGKLRLTCRGGLKWAYHVLRTLCEIP